MRFPPPSSGERPSLTKEGYRVVHPGARFILPPPSTPDSTNPDQVLEEVATQLKQWGELAEWSAETAVNQGAVIEDYGSTLSDLVENRVVPWAVPTVAPLSQTINRRADPTFQLSDFMVPLMRGRSDAAGHNHQHDTTTEAHRMQAGMNTKGRIYYAWVTPSVTRAYDRLDFLVSEITNPCRMDVAVYVLDPDTKILNLQRLNEDITIPLSETVATVQMDPWVATQGSYICIAWLQHGSGNSRYIYGLDDTPRPLTTDVFPPKISATNQILSQTQLPQHIDGNNATVMDFSGYWFTPYAELSEAVQVQPRFYSEPWPNVGREIGRPWVPLTSQGIGSGGGYTSAYGVGIRVSVYESPLSSDRVRVRTSIHSDSSGGNVRRSTLVVRGNNDLSTGLGLSALSRTRYELIQWTGLGVNSNEEWDDRTVLVTIPRAPQQGDQIEVDYLEGSVTVRINGEVEVQDLTVGGLNGPEFRFVGIQNRRQAFITASWSPWFGHWTAQDLPPSGGDDDDSNTD